MFTQSRRSREFARRRTAISRSFALLPVAAAIALSSPAGADVRVGGGSNGYYTVQVKSWWEIPFRTVVRQHYDFSCGSAAVATLLTYHYDIPTNENTPFVAMWQAGEQDAIRKTGFSMLDMKNYLESLGFQVAGFRLEAQQLSALNRPAIVLLDLKGYKHFVVIKGISDNEVLIGDPALGLRKMSMDDFSSAWNGIVLAIVKTPDNRQAIFNRASEWDPWARAPTTQGIDRRTVGDLMRSFRRSTRSPRKC
jgi:predicted double-glycine peptidase